MIEVLKQQIDEKEQLNEKTRQEIKDLNAQIELLGEVVSIEKFKYSTKYFSFVRDEIVDLIKIQFAKYHLDYEALERAINETEK